MIPDIVILFTKWLIAEISGIFCLLVLFLFKKKWIFSAVSVLLCECGPKLFKNSKIFEFGINLDNKLFNVWAYNVKKFELTL